ncbi:MULTISPECIES: sensor histidine kinase [Legionella]|uniref:histidine kinase n=1 Tax=Legionella drozanskii LLAP-1 TaxID=1212489 RepID=A0A0W0TEV2_9GAMM|nr:MULTISPECIES: sensor histidine kinase KdpD [Legionella]KTC93749.1 osmosensitive K+ channel His-kinase sensor [Legionella drozanskii LLAP-1]
MSKPRPNPDQLLARAQKEAGKESQGKLKIYLGAAPGVGKTHEMLEDALEKRAQGLDVIVGLAESHGRKDIERLLENFEILPRQIVQYHSKECMEFDLDAALRRHPGLILVDEMAHSNPSELRHSKRWQDIKELLDRGIDVYTTLNVQHIESLKDSVAKIIQAPIKETVPDSMIERADTIELIDLPPEDLIKRLHEGKVYIPEQAELACEHFFRKGNLTALRELALRVTAERVDTDVLWYRQGERIKHIWPTKDRILVCVGSKPETLKLIRGAKRLANSLQADWLAVYIETPSLQTLPEEHKKALENLRLAELLGAETHMLMGVDIVKEIVNFAQEQNVTQIMIWKNIRVRFRDWFRRNLADEIVRHSSEIDIYIMTGEVSKSSRIKTKVTQESSWKIYAVTVGIVILTTSLNMVLYPYLAASNLVMVYLLAVTMVALFGRTGPSILVSVLSVIAYDFFFIPPIYSFAVSDIEYVLTLLVMLLVTQIISQLTIQSRKRAEAAQSTQHQTTSLYTFSRKLMSTRGMARLLELGVNHIARVFDSKVMALVPKNNTLKVQASSPPQSHLDAKELSIAQWVYDMQQIAGYGTDTLSSSDALYLPLKGTTEVIGVLRIQSLTQQQLMPEQKGMLEACINQLALALEVDRLYEKTKQKELETEKVRAKTALLKSIFNDLCFPLKRVINTVNSLKNSATAEEIDREINKLNRLNNNLYQVIELESQGINLNKIPCSIKAMIETVIKTSVTILEKRPIQLIIPENLPLISVDDKLIHEVLLNLFENAIKFSPPNSPIHAIVEIEQNNMVVSIDDFGTGILLYEKNKLFKKFYRSKQTVTQHGLGLGLAICEKIIKAHEGEIWVENIENQGASFRFSLPL